MFWLLHLQAIGGSSPALCSLCLAADYVRVVKSMESALAKVQSPKTKPRSPGKGGLGPGPGNVSAHAHAVFLT
jgi:hypothetical protein